MPLCNAKKRQCRICEHRFPKEEYELDACPECGESRLCRNHVKYEGARCRYHGGASLKGIMSPEWVHGSYSKYLPDRLVGRYEEAQRDQELLNLRSDIALLHTRLTELLETLETSVDGNLWIEMADNFKSLKAAIQNQDPRATRRALTSIDGLVQKGSEQVTLWSEIYDILERRRRLIESERKRLVDMHQMISAEVALTMIANIQAIIMEHVTDEDALSAISGALRDISLRDTGRQLTAP